jgi:hypothetical protein
MEKEGGFEDCCELAGDLRLTEGCGEALLLELRRDMLDEVREAEAGKEEKDVRRSTWPARFVIPPFVGGRKGSMVDISSAGGRSDGGQARSET